MADSVPGEAVKGLCVRLVAVLGELDAGPADGPSEPPVSLPRQRFTRPSEDQAIAVGQRRVARSMSTARTGLFNEYARRPLRGRNAGR